jgi:hypothetical protein
MDTITISYTPARVRETAAGPRFRIKRLAEVRPDEIRDLTATMDRTYDYASARELRWHLADRFGLNPDRLVLERH